MMSIQPLPPDVIAQIKSSTTITNLNGVIVELVKNSLDAGSTKIDISVDYARGGCVVEDDGLGILPSEFGESGGLGKIYRKLVKEKYLAVLTTRRFFQAGMPDSTSWWTRDISCFSFGDGSHIHHISSPLISISQFNEHAQISSNIPSNSSISSTILAVFRPWYSGYSQRSIRKYAGSSQAKDNDFGKAGEWQRLGTSETRSCPSIARVAIRCFCHHKRGHYEPEGCV